VPRPAADAAGGVGDGKSGTLVPGAPASYAVWGHRHPRPHAPRDAVQRWSTDPRSRVPALPRLGPTDAVRGAAKPCIEVPLSMADESERESEAPAPDAPSLADRLGATARRALTGAAARLPDAQAALLAVWCGWR